MPAMTYPNQRMINIHREAVQTDFLGIKNENWKAASRDLSAHAFKLYIYLAANADNFKLALSPAAVRQEIGMARSTFHDQFHVLLDKGYLVHSHGNTFEFYETSQSGSQLCKNREEQAGHDFENDTDTDHAMPSAVISVLPEDIQINNSGNTIMAINNRNDRPVEKNPNADQTQSEVDRKLEAIRKDIDRCTDENGEFRF